ncbi:MAG: hypothetical protein OXD42_00495, partial [Rhodospirillaceae bacterium]|nr:hypothetical protein [Rhodospirillaceae bacterium]
MKPSNSPSDTHQKQHRKLKQQHNNHTKQQKSTKQQHKANQKHNIARTYHRKQLAPRWSAVLAETSPAGKGLSSFVQWRIPHLCVGKTS